jgi:hypothetical protein
MQIRLCSWVKTIHAFGLLLFFTSTGVNAQVGQDFQQFRQRTDSLFKAANALCKQDSTGRKASNWMNKATALQAIIDDAELREKYKELDLHIELAQALGKASENDVEGMFAGSTSNGLAAITQVLADLGKQALLASQRFDSPLDAEKAVQYFQECLEAYKHCGKTQNQVDAAWKNIGISWQWIRFYKAVAYRKSGKEDLAEKEYSTLIKMGWDEPQVFLELADLFRSTGKMEEVQKILLQGIEKKSANIPLNCALTRHYLQTDQLKKAMAQIKPFDAWLGYNSNLVLTKALVYEKKGDLKKADALFKALHKSDPHEVEINSEYAAYLIRKAKNSEAFDAEEFADKAYNLMHHASELSPENATIISEMASIKSRYPKVKIEKNDN